MLCSEPPLKKARLSFSAASRTCLSSCSSATNAPVAPASFHAPSSYPRSSTAATCSRVTPAYESMEPSLWSLIWDMAGVTAEEFVSNIITISKGFHAMAADERAWPTCLRKGKDVPDHVWRDWVERKMVFRQIELKKAQQADQLLSQHLRRMPVDYLESLDLALSDVSDAGMSSLVGLPLLKSLSLSQCDGITAEGLELLQTIPLQSLDLSSCSVVTNECLHILASVPLTKLLLVRCKGVTDEGLISLAGMNLQHLDLRECNVSFLGSGGIYKASARGFLVESLNASCKCARNLFFLSFIYYHCSILQSSAQSSMFVHTNVAVTFCKFLAVSACILMYTRPTLSTVECVLCSWESLSSISISIIALDCRSSCVVATFSDLYNY
eukprot:g36872.t1